VDAEVVPPVIRVVGLNAYGIWDMGMKLLLGDTGLDQLGV